MVLKEVEIKKYITSKLTYLTNYIDGIKKLNFSDDLHGLENLFKDIFKKLYGWGNLINLNNLISNHPAIDLGDSIKKIAIQITSSNNFISKIKDTLEKFEKNKLQSTYNKVYVFFVTFEDIEKPEYETNNYKYEILTIRNILIDIDKLEFKDLEEIYKIFKSRLDGDENLTNEAKSELKNAKRPNSKNSINIEHQNNLLKDVINDEVYNNFEDDVDIAEIQRWEYLSNYIPILLDGTYFSEKLDDIEYNFRNQIDGNPRLILGRYKNFSSIEEKIYQTVDRSRDSFARYGLNKDDIFEWLLTSDSVICGCFYQQVVKEYYNFKLDTKDIEKYLTILVKKNEE